MKWTKLEYFDICSSGRLDKMIAHCPMCMSLNRSVHNLVANGHTARASKTDVSSILSEPYRSLGDLGQSLYTEHR
jgi:hypothetical protein